MRGKQFSCTDAAVEFFSKKEEKMVTVSVFVLLFLFVIFAAVDCGSNEELKVALQSLLLCLAAIVTAAILPLIF